MSRPSTDAPAVRRKLWRPRRANTCICMRWIEIMEPAGSSTEQIMPGEQLAREVDQNLEARPEFAGLVADRDVMTGKLRRHRHQAREAAIDFVLHDANGNEPDRLAAKHREDRHRNAVA